jgi:hypothetical protein
MRVVVREPISHFRGPFDRIGSSSEHVHLQPFADQLLEPAYTGPDHVPDLELPLLRDLGWR